MFSLPCSMFQLLMEVETLLLTPTTPQLRIWTAKLYPLTLFFFFFLLIQTIFAMGRCCSLSTRSTRRNPRPTCTHRHRTAVHLLYPIPYASNYMQYILLPPPTCFSVSTLLTPVIVTLSAQCIPTKLVLSELCIYHRMSVYILCTSTKCRLCTTPVVPHPPFLSPPGRPQADGSPLMCRGSA